MPKDGVTGRLDGLALREYHPYYRTPATFKTLDPESYEILNIPRFGRAMFAKGKRT